MFQCATALKQPVMQVGLAERSITGVQYERKELRKFLVKI